jgi:MFS family permease
LNFYFERNHFANHGPPGINQAYGVFQSYYTNAITVSGNVLTPSQSQNSALVAFVGTLATGLTWGGSVFVNPLMARTSDLHIIAGAGALLMAAGYALASLSTSIWHLFLTQSLLAGAGSSLLYFPLLSVAPEYFGARRGAAMGFVLSGAGVGGLCLSPVTQALLDRFGARWTLRALAACALVIGGPVALAASPSRSQTRRPTLVNVRIARKPAFILQALAALLQAGGNTVPINFMPDFAVAMGYTAAAGAVFLTINNGINSASRIGMGFMADALGRQNTLVVSVLGSAVTVVSLWLLAASGAKGPWIGFVVMYGILAGGYNALFPTTITEVFGIQAYASVNGFLYFVRGLGALFGSPVGGAILSSKRSGHSAADYQSVIWYDGALLFASSLCVIGVRGFDAWEKGKWNWKA